MDSNVLQTLRYKLQKRLKRIHSANPNVYQNVLVQTWKFLNDNPLIQSILNNLELRVPSAESDSEKITGGTSLVSSDELEHVAISSWLIKRTVTQNQPGKASQLGRQVNRTANVAEGLELFTETYIEPLFDYLDEQLDDRRTTLHLLRKYKQRVEWFQRDDLFTRFKDDTQRGEKGLAKDLYAYLHDQGLEFSIEPSSISGEADLVASQTGPDRLVADVKIFDPERSKGLSYLHKGFHQVYQYTKDYHTTFGYLIIFKTCEADLSVNARDQDTAIPFFTHNNKTIFVLVIDIFPHPTSASKRGTLKSHELLESDLIRVLEAPEPP